MGVDTRLTLPVSVQVRDVATVIAILLGKPRTWTDCTETNNCRKGLAEPTKRGWVSVSGISFSVSDGQPECCTINISDIPEMYGNGWWFFYHFEFDGKFRGMLGGSRAERIALHRRLAAVFGGQVDYSDCDEVRCNYRRKSPAWLEASGDNHFHAKNLAFWNLKPITAEEIADCEQFASYKK